MYQSYYKLRGKPFQLTPDPELLFPSKGHKRAMSYLLYGFEQGEGFVMITGAVGTGKTLLIQMLFEQLAARNIAMASIASTNLDGPDILPAVASAFNLPYEGRSKETLLQDLRRYLVTLRAHHTHALLVVDEAQTLTPSALEVLRILSNFEIKGKALLQIFLVGQTELRRTIVANHMEQLRQRIIASYRLEPLDQEESRAYILHRLRAVGWKGDPEITPDVFLEAQRFSGGIPRKINLIMDRLLLYGYLEETHHLGQDEFAVVIHEIHEEMSGMPTTLEASIGQESVDLAHLTAVTEKENQLAILELKLNDILRQMREKIKLKDIVQHSYPLDRIHKESLSSNARHARSKREEK